MKSVLINGAKGKMGAMIADIINNNAQFGLQVVCMCDRGDFCEKPIDIVIDFSLPEGAAAAYKTAKEKNAAILVGTTNLPAGLLDTLKAERDIPVFYATNVSIGVYLFGELLKTANNLFAGYDRSMREIHHIHKVDAPSGTAKTLASLINFPEMQIEAVREGEVPGTHSLSFDSPYEHISLTHEAKKRALFAESAVLVAAWLVKQSAGFYSMADYVAATTKK